MVSINYAFREICCKIVYYGPGLSGKTTNLICIHKKAPPQTKGELISLATDADRTLYFDFLPLDIGQVQGFSTKFQLYTVPGQVYYNATRKLVLRGVDGLVFVADSQAAKLEENIESMHNLVENLEEYGYELEELPMIMQYNKRDLEEVSSIEELEGVLNPRGLLYFEAVAVSGVGVFDTLKGISKLVLEKARTKSDPEERKELVSVVASPKICTPTSVRGKEPELEPVPLKGPVEEEEKVDKSESADEASKVTELVKEKKVEEREIVKVVRPAEKIERKEKTEEEERLPKEDKMEEVEKVEKVKEETLVQSQAEVRKETLESKEVLEQQVRAGRGETKPLFYKKVIVSPMLKQKKAKSAWGGFLWRWIEKIVGRR